MNKEKKQREKQEALKAHFVSTAAKEVQLILEYISINGLELDDESLKTLSNARVEITEDECDPVKEAKFWKAYSKASQLIHPVTLESIKSTKSEFGSRSLFGQFFGGRKRSDAHRSLMGYRLTAIIVLIAVLIVQIIWLIGNTLVNDTIGQIKSLESELNNRIELKQDQSLAIKARDSTVLAALEEKQLLQVGKINMVLKNIAVNQKLILTWANTARYFIPPISVITRDMTVPDIPEFDFEDRQNEERIDEQVKNLIVSEAEITHALVVPLRMILLYVLPLMYGLLGACAYVLRVLGNDIKDYTYIKNHNVNLSLRLQLGALAGLIVDWFISPVTSKEMVDEISIANLSPLALSFLAGYSIELLFTAMDKYVLVYARKGDSKDD